MKFTLIYKNSRDKLQAENYKNDEGRFNREDIKHISQAIDWGEKIIEWYNSTLRENETEREFVICLNGHHALEINHQKSEKEKFKYITERSMSSLMEIMEKVNED